MREYDLTEQVQKAWRFFDKLLDEKLDRIAKLSGIERDRLKKINPADFVVKSSALVIRNYRYQNIGEWIESNKTPDTFCISPIDEDVETANQISYKSGNTERKIRAHKCQLYPIPSLVARRFFIKNHRQSVPNITKEGVSFGLVYEGELVAVMTYDLTSGGVRGKLKAEMYELLRLSLKHGAKINGGASKLEKKCEEALLHYGCSEIFSYSNATINEGEVYKQLGFKPSKIVEGQAWVVEPNMTLQRLLRRSDNQRARNEDIYKDGAFKTHIVANRTWIKKIQIED